jgi:hypothetical protein
VAPPRNLDCSAFAEDDHACCDYADSTDSADSADYADYADYAESAVSRGSRSVRTARMLAGMESGPVLAGWIGTIDVACLGVADLMLVAGARERQRRFDAAWDHDLLAAVHAAPVGAPTEQAILALVAKGSPDPQLQWEGDSRAARADELATRIGASPIAVSRRIAIARQLGGAGRLHATGDLLRAGLLPESHARLVAVTLEAHDDELAIAVAGSVLPKASQLTYRQLHAALKRALATVRHLDEDAANMEARLLRRVGRPVPCEFGMSAMEVFGPAEDLQQLWIALDGLGLRAKADAVATTAETVRTDDGPAEAPRPMSLDAHRFDALIALADRAYADRNLPKRQGRHPAIQVTVALSTLLDLNDEPADLDGYGPITARTARRIAADTTATWRRLLLDDAGVARDYGTTVYRPPQDLIDAVIARDQTCTFPGCTRPAREADIDHQIPWPAGPTSERNNHALCRTRHHPQKTMGIWTPNYDPATGDTRWTHATGHNVVRPAAAYPVTTDAVLRYLTGELRCLSPDQPSEPTDLPSF